MCVMASLITSVSITYLTVSSSAGQRKYQSSVSLAFMRGPVTGELLAQRGSDAENVLILWWHHATWLTETRKTRQLIISQDLQKKRFSCNSVPGSLYCETSWQLNSLRPRQSGHHFPNVDVKCTFLNENGWILIRISLKISPKVPIYNKLALVQIMAWCLEGY